MTVPELADLLRRALNEPSTRISLIDQFQRNVFNTVPTIREESAWEVLRGLAYDLEFYEPDTTLRAEDSSYFGDEIAEQQIKCALTRLGE